jgi:phage N-6-adenine-methyltransferase
MSVSAKKGFSHESQSARTVDWWTPEWLFEAMGLEFDLDPCQPVGGVPWIPAKSFYTKEDDGLAQPWQGRVWLNPPYGKQTPQWLKKMSEHKNGVALVFSRTDCKWFHDYITNADAVLFLKGRIGFIDGYKLTKQSGAGNGSLMAAWGGECVEALRRMEAAGKGWLKL